MPYASLCKAESRRDSHTYHRSMTCHRLALVAVIHVCACIYNVYIILLLFRDILLMQYVYILYTYTTPVHLSWLRPRAIALVNVMQRRKKTSSSAAIVIYILLYNNNAINAMQRRKKGMSVENNMLLGLNVDKFRHWPKRQRSKSHGNGSSFMIPRSAYQNEWYKWFIIYVLLWLRI